MEGDLYNVCWFNGQLVKCPNPKARFILPANMNAKQILMSYPCLRCECFAGVEHISTDANYLLRVCEVKIRIRRKYELGFTFVVML